MGETKRGKLVFRLLTAVLISFAGACSFAPTAELKVFRESVTAANTAATPVIDEVSATERRIIRQTTAVQEQASYSSGATVAFDVGKARYFSEIGDGPAASLFRRGHDVLGRLADLLLSLATGAGADSDVGAVESLATEVAGLIEVVQPGAAAAEGVGQNLLHQSLLEVSKELQRREARRIIDAARDSHLVENLTARLTSASPQIFRIMITEASASARSVRATDATAKAYADRVAKVRLVVANYVVLLDQVNVAWLEAVKAADSKNSGNIGVLTDRVGELKAAAVATRKAYADMNASR